MGSFTGRLGPGSTEEELRCPVRGFRDKGLRDLARLYPSCSAQCSMHALGRPPARLGGH